MRFLTLSKTNLKFSMFSSSAMIPFVLFSAFLPFWVNSNHLAKINDIFMMAIGMFLAFYLVLGTMRERDNEISKKEYTSIWTPLIMVWYLSLIIPTNPLYGGITLLQSFWF